MDLLVAMGQVLVQYCMHSSIKMTSYKVVYGVPPPRLLNYVPGTTRVEAVDEVLRNREQILNLFQQNIKKAQHRMKNFADLKRSKREFEVGAVCLLETASLLAFNCCSPPVPQAVAPVLWAFSGNSSCGSSGL